MGALLLYGPPSPCHREPTLIVQSREGGFVTRNCAKCGKPHKLSRKDMPKRYCGQCGLPLTRYQNPRHNFAYRCDQCGISFELADIVPWWYELFDYHGFAIDRDYC